ncbi:MAG: sugar transferase [Thermoanaerobaculia bacterium]
MAKRLFDIVLSALGLFLTWWLILLAYAISTIETRRNGFFVQKRVGRDGVLFDLIKIRTMRDDPAMWTTVTSSVDPRITPVGGVLRKTKLDELPQLINVLRGDMSFVGPRPDVPGFADELQGDDRIILQLRPGITGPATLRFRDEESVLAAQADPERYNREVIWPDKVRINRRYAESHYLLLDLKYILMTVVPALIPASENGEHGPRPQC